MGYEISDKRWLPAEFEAYLQGRPRPDWCDGICYHHTAFPDLAMRPAGLTEKHQRNLRHYYEKVKGWSDGPHLFIDDDEIIGMSGLEDDGVHAIAFNRNFIGIEVLGNFDHEDPTSGRGADCWRTALDCGRMLLDWLGKSANDQTVKFHREDPRTSKTCPGKLVKKPWVINRIRSGWPNEDSSGNSKDIEAKDKGQKINIPGWNIYQIIDGGYFVPVLDFLDHVGGDRDLLIQLMSRQNGKFVYNGDVIESAFYDKDSETTWALASELLGFT